MSELFNQACWSESFFASALQAARSLFCCSGEIVGADGPEPHGPIERGTREQGRRRLTNLEEKRLWAAARLRRETDHRGHPVGVAVERHDGLAASAVAGPRRVARLVGTANRTGITPQTGIG